ncbi:clathrin-coated vesicle protein [Trichosporon asahii var. asahii CBS 8904]|uniref:Clathrin-coated vesicle protein n=2 Tax=Trichosporon asahii var. asahii TaxID=189963 RepID=K1VMD7_TRIAC|nr:clathrin-coated vesicle protein [Trichosporon asahii var. asahii CBS 2479]EJT45147.1 clathrin-coated vesicle protein [Trichosporon asahii var. asahii CBS 2479]EKD00537.1 clathrin-coated vesicle protein [Trichosporon asahii var. asahii CBS 8904]
MFAAASSLFGKSSTLSAYTLKSAGPSPNASSTNVAGRGSPAPGGPAGKTFNVGLWKVIPATHKTTGKDVSVWVLEKRVLDGLRAGGRDFAIEQLKKEATALSRLRHPDILHMVEPLEETRSELTFVTETVTSSLGNLLAAAKSGKGGRDGEVDLDEVEIQKGTLQIAKGLAFIHTQAKSVHLNLNPDAILVNAKGDWKLSGLNFITPLQRPDGSASKYEFPEVDPRMPPQVQWKFDYLGLTADLLPRLLTRRPNGRISLSSLTTHPFFSSLAISTLNFLDPTTFASKPREEKATFLRGLVRVLPTFSDRLKKGKILLSLLEEMKDPYLLPFLLPNVFEISKTLNKEEFAQVLPKLQPLFAMKDPPQNMLSKLPLIAVANLSSARQLVTVRGKNKPADVPRKRHAAHLQLAGIRAPSRSGTSTEIGPASDGGARLWHSSEYPAGQGCSMVSTLDATTLTSKLVPLLAKIKTKEPAVTMATLSVHEAMGQKVSLDAIATLLTPVLNTDQFARFMSVIQTLGARVEREHSQHLREVRKMEEQTATMNVSNGDNPFDFSGQSQEVDFETLVKGGTPSASTPAAASTADPWDMDNWGNDDLNSIPGFGAAPKVSTPTLGRPAISTQSSFTRSTSPPQGKSPRAGSSRLGARQVSSSSFNSAAFESPKPSAFQALQPQSSTLAPLQPTSSSLSTLSPTPQRPAPQPAQPASASSAPNYNISLPPMKPKSPPGFGAPLQPTRGMSPKPYQPMQSMQPMQAQPAASAAPPGWSNGVMQPTAAPKPAWNASQAASTDWGDFDPLK